MPIGANNTYKVNETEGNSGVSKIFALYDKNSDGSTIGRQNKATIVLKSDLAFNATLGFLASGLYTSAAGCDLSSIFFPYQARSSGTNVKDTMPLFDGKLQPSSVYSLKPVNLYTLMPYQFQNTNTIFVQDMAYVPSGDSHKSLVSSELFRGNVDYIRSLDDIRSIGIRLPAVGVGWGYTTWGDPFPSGDILGSGHTAKYLWRTSSTNQNDVNVEDGWRVDPNSYVAAPIDLRYDPYNHVWTSPKGFWAEVASQGSGLYSWREIIYGFNGTASYGSRSGNISQSPAIEANHDSDASGIVFLQPKEHRHYYLFAKGGGGGGNNISAVGQYQYMVYQMISNNSAGWDYVRAHP